MIQTLSTAVTLANQQHTSYCDCLLVLTARFGAVAVGSSSASGAAAAFALAFAFPEALGVAFGLAFAFGKGIVFARDSSVSES